MTLREKARAPPIKSIRSLSLQHDDIYRGAAVGCAPAFLQEWGQLLVWFKRP